MKFNANSFYKKIILPRFYSLYWGHEIKMEFLNFTNFNYKCLMKYIDTNDQEHYKRTVIILPNNPGDSDNYLQLCYYLFQNNYRVIIPNYPRTNKVRKLSDNDPECYSTDFLASYLTKFMETINLKRTDFVIADGWSGYDALFLETFTTRSNVLLVNFPKIFSFTNASIGSISIELANRMHDNWHILLVRLLMTKYLKYKMKYTQKDAIFSNLSFEEILETILHLGGAAVDKTGLKMSINSSLSVGLVNLPDFRSIPNPIGNYRSIMKISDSDIFTIDINDWKCASPRRKYEINLTTKETEFTIDSKQFSQFLINWMEILLEMNFITEANNVLKKIY